MGDGSQMHGELFGRERERKTIETTLHQVFNGSGQAVVIRGPVGIGKTALLRYTAEEAVRRGAQVLTSAGDILEQDFPWEGVRRLFEQGIADSSRQIIPVHPNHDGPSLVARLHALYWLTIDIVRKAPLVLLIDDSHWLDELSLRWLAYMAGRIDGEPILLLTAARPGGREDEAGAWAALVSQGKSMDLEPLDEHSSRLLLAQASREVDESLWSAIWRETGGNPFLLTQVARALRERSVFPDVDDRSAIAVARRASAPQLALRISRLGRDCARVASAIALLGPSATHSRVEVLCGFTQDQTTQAVQRLYDDGLLQLRPRLAFRHPLFEAAAYEARSPQSRALLHRDAARLVHAAGEPPGVWAPHLLQARTSGDRWVVARLREAAREAWGRSSPGIAATYLRRAWREPPEPDQQVTVLLELAEAEAASDPSAAANDYRRALGLSPDWRQGTRARVGLANCLAFRGAFADATAVLEAALTEIPRDETRTRDEVLVAILNTARYDPRARAQYRTHVSRARERVSSEIPAIPQLRANVALELLAEGVDREHTVREALESLEDLAGDSLEDVMWAAVLMTPLICGGLLDLASRHNERRVHVIRERGWTPALGMALATHAKLHLWRGDVTAALADAGEALTISEDPISTAHAATFLAEARRLRGELKAAWRVLEEHGLVAELPDIWPYPLLLADRAMLHLELHRDPHRALADLEICRRHIDSMDLRCPSLVPWRPRMAQVLHAMGADQEAASLAADEVEAARRWGELGTLGEALRTSAIFVETPERIAVLEEAVATLDGSERRLDLAGALVDLGASLRRDGRRHDAQWPLRRGMAMADRAGALALLGRADEELRAAGGRPRRAAIQGRDSLTPSELRVAMLASEGRSNPDIARLLFITRRTVETHLTQSYAKLGVRSRSDLAEVLRGPG